MERPMSQTPSHSNWVWPRLKLCGVRSRTPFLVAARGFCLVLWLWACGAIGQLKAIDLQLNLQRPSMDRWMYPFNFEPGIRPVAPTFASFDPRFDTRDAQFLIGWDTDALVPTNQPVARYLFRSVRLTLTVVGNSTFIYDPTFDSYLTHATNSPGYFVDTDPGRPIEVFGVGFRGDFSPATFKENSFFGQLNSINSGNISIETRNAYAAAFDDRGHWIDIANHVGQHNAGWTNAPFEVHPWAVGVTAGAHPGELVPADSQFTFDVDLTHPRILGYFQQALSEGRLRLMVSSLSPATQVTPGGTGGGGTGSYPQWATSDNLLYDAPRLQLEGVLVSEEDTDRDGLPDDWERFYFSGLTSNPNDDSDQDLASNRIEFQCGTNPTRADPIPIAVQNLRVLQIEPEGTVRLGFQSKPGAKYRVEVSFDLKQWRSASGEATPGNDGADSVIWKETDPTVPPTSRFQAYYRVATE